MVRSGVLVAATAVVACGSSVQRNHTSPFFLLQAGGIGIASVPSLASLLADDLSFALISNIEIATVRPTKEVPNPSLDMGLELFSLVLKVCGPFRGVASPPFQCRPILPAPPPI